MSSPLPGSHAVRDLNIASSPETQHIQNRVSWWNRSASRVTSFISHTTIGSYVTANTTISASSGDSARHGKRDSIANGPIPDSIPESVSIRLNHGAQLPALSRISSLASLVQNILRPSRPASPSQDETNSPGEGETSYECRKPCPDGRFCVLSLDGGGCRGYISLLTLKHLLKQIQPEGPIYPYLYFDLICGTSTGGLIAILLAVLHLDIDTALQIYYRLVGQVFADDFSVLRYLLKDAGYSRKPLERAIAEILQNYGGGRTLLADAAYDRGCRCFITTAHCVGEQRNVLAIRSYQSSGYAPTIPDGHQWTCRDAALATAAAPGVFDQHYITKDEHRFGFEDAGGHRTNNPTKFALEECRKLGVAEESLFISLGTGTRRAINDPEAAGCFGLFQNKIETFKASMRYGRDVNDVHEWMKEEVKKSGMSYFRLNPPLGRRISLGDWKELPAMEDSVVRYCEQHKTEFNNCALQLRLFQTAKRGTVVTMPPAPPLPEPGFSGQMSLPSRRSW